MFFFSDLIKDALYFSAEKHDGQYRKGSKVPYIVHPTLVGLILSHYTTDDHIVAAGFLHDVLEDCVTVSEEDIKHRFGERVARLVKEVSFLEPEENHLSWKEKKSTYLKKIETISSDALYIVAADKMNNMKAYFEGLKVDPEKVNSLFKASADDYRWYYAEVQKILNKKLGECSIVKEYNTMFSVYK